MVSPCGFDDNDFNDAIFNRWFAGSLNPHSKCVDQGMQKHLSARFARGRVSEMTKMHMTSLSLSLSRALSLALSLSLSNQVLSALKAAQSNAGLLANYSLETAALKAQIGQLTRELREEQEEREKLCGLVNAGQSIVDQLRLAGRSLQDQVHDLEAQNAVLKQQLDETTRRLQAMTLTHDHSEDTSQPDRLPVSNLSHHNSQSECSMPSTSSGYLHRHPHAHQQGYLSLKGFH